MMDFNVLEPKPLSQRALAYEYSIALKTLIHCFSENLGTFEGLRDSFPNGALKNLIDSQADRTKAAFENYVMATRSLEKGGLMVVVRAKTPN